MGDSAMLTDSPALIHSSFGFIRFMICAENGSATKSNLALPHVCIPFVKGYTMSTKASAESLPTVALSIKMGLLTLNFIAFRAAWNIFSFKNVSIVDIYLQ